MSYQLTNCGVLRLADNANIPADPRNRDWREYQDWLDAGNQPLPAEPPPEPIPEPSLIDKIKALSPDELQSLRNLLAQ